MAGFLVGSGGILARRQHGSLESLESLWCLGFILGVASHTRAQTSSKENLVRAKCASATKKVTASVQMTNVALIVRRNWTTGLEEHVLTWNWLFRL